MVAIASRGDETHLRSILGFPEWNVLAAPGLRVLTAAVKTCSCGVVIAARHLPDGHSWKEVLDNIRQVSNPPQLIVADRLADDSLWAEALNLGAYDLLMIPFEPAEVQRVVTMAWEFSIRNAPCTAQPAKARADIHLPLVGPPVASLAARIIVARPGNQSG